MSELKKIREFHMYKNYESRFIDKLESLIVNSVEAGLAIVKDEILNKGYNLYMFYFSTKRYIIDGEVRYDAPDEPFNGIGYFIGELILRKDLIEQKDNIELSGDSEFVVFSNNNYFSITNNIIVWNKNCEQIYPPLNE